MSNMIPKVTVAGDAEANSPILPPEKTSNSAVVQTSSNDYRSTAVGPAG
jgi:hypothetical protein